MDQLNWLVILPTGIIPLIVGFIYYNPRVLGTVWMKASGMTPESGRNMNMTKVFGFTLILGVFLATALVPTVFHFMHAFSLVQPDAVPGTAGYDDALAFTGKYMSNFRSFGHGAFHAVLTTIFLVWPVLAITAMFENRGWKYTAVHLGYFMITLGLMGGIICAFGVK